MVNPRELDARLLLGIILIVSSAKSKHEKGQIVLKSKHEIHFTGSKTKIDKGNPWPFLPRPGSHYTAFPGYPSYPFLIIAPPDISADSKEKLKDTQGSKYYTSKRQSVAYSQVPTTGPGYIPVYYVNPQYLTDQLSYTNFYQIQPYQDSANLDERYLQYPSSYGSIQPYPSSTFILFKRSHTRKVHGMHRKQQPDKKQFVPRHHWSFSQWPFDSHEYTFTHSPHALHLPRWGPIEWGGAGPGKHWATNREGLPSPFGIGLAPHMGGQGYVGLEGHWLDRHGYPLPTNFLKSPIEQHGFP